MRSDLEEHADELSELAARLRAALDTWNECGAQQTIDRLRTEAEGIGRAWSGSTYGYHACVYYKDFAIPPPGAHFSAMWGLMGFGDTRGDWVEHDRQAVMNHIYDAAGVQDLTELQTAAQTVLDVYNAARADTRSILSILTADHEDAYLEGVSSKVADLRVVNLNRLLHSWLPNQAASRDETALAQGFQNGPHQVVIAQCHTLESPASIARALGRVIDEVTKHLGRKSKVPSSAPALAVADTCDVLLVTVTEIETRHALERLQRESGKPDIRFQGAKTYFHFPPIEGTTVVLVRSEMGSDTVGGSAITVRDAVNHVAPSTIIMAGIAFGVAEDKQPIGTVLVAKQLQAYDLKRVGTDETGEVVITPRGDRVSCSARPLDRLRTAQLSWAGTVEFGLLLSGQTLVDNKDHRNALRELHPEAIGGEMEGAGLYAAAVEQAEWAVVKAVCDWADGNKREDKARRQETASVAAMDFVVYAISQGGFRPR